MLTELFFGSGNCMNACYGAAQYVFAGTEYADECWCGSIPPPLANQNLDEYCNMACDGDPNYSCGGSGYLSVYYDPTKYTAGADPSLYGPQTIQKAGNYTYLGCYSEATTGRALNAYIPTAPTSGFTIESCEVACHGYTYFGMEYSNEVSAKFLGDSLKLLTRKVLLWQCSRGRISQSN